MKTVSATIQIDARPAQVWAALTDLAAYPRWNPLFPEASGQIARRLPAHKALKAYVEAKR